MQLSSGQLYTFIYNVVHQGMVIAEIILYFRKHTHVTIYSYFVFSFLFKSGGSFPLGELIHSTPQDCHREVYVACYIYHHFKNVHYRSVSNITKFAKLRQAIGTATLSGEALIAEDLPHLHSNLQEQEQ